MIESAEVGPRRELLLGIILCPIHYPNHGAITVRMGSIENLVDVTHFAERLRNAINEGRDSKRLCTINGFGYDSKRESTANSLFLVLDIEHAGRIQIQCKKLTFGEQGGGAYPPPAARLLQGKSRATGSGSAHP